MKTTRTWIIIVSMLVFLCGKASAYCLMGSGCPQSGTGWPGDTATFHSNGFSGSNSTFDSAFVDALNIWNGLSDFSYSSINGSVEPCGGPDGTRGWKAAPNMCGGEEYPFGFSTLAVAVVWLSGFTNEIIDADIIFNNTKTWDLHSGSGSDFDFKRVAAHELGHALGLDHDNTPPALMNTTYSQTIETPQTDDINGLCALYSGSACASPAPDIKANGTDGTVTPTGNLSVTVALAPGNRSGDNADWWVAADTPLGWYYFDLSTFGFVYAGASALDILATLQGPLLDLPTSEILNIPVSVLISGTYTFYFAVDTNMNGLLDIAELFSDFVNVIVTDSNPCSAYAGNWSGTYLDAPYCDGLNYFGTWTAVVTSDCAITAITDEGDFYEGTITGNNVSGSGFDPYCGTVSVVGTVGGNSMSGTYTYSLGGSGSFSGSKD